MEYFEMLKMAIPLLAVGGAWGGAKAALNGTRLRVEKLETHNVHTLDRLARIETKIDQVLERK